MSANLGDGRRHVGYGFVVVNLVHRLVQLVKSAVTQQAARRAERRLVVEQFVQESRRRSGAGAGRHALRLDQLLQPADERLLQLRQILHALLEHVELLAQLVALILLRIDDADRRTDIRRTFRIERKKNTSY